MTIDADFLPIPTLKGEITRELDLKTVRRAFEPSPGALVIDDEEIAVGPVDVAQSHINQRQARG